ncbi:hypothetical protein BDV96DRAFT_98075 [Lophiotrema nucula]|uniref:Transmembrane protein n=1 Tax=Lophiotrema nucula TaxID=690887 RepID=A0A6A5Z4U9_9PLEO|nr:hypothetical protein BDV96DRAFT_98075 [Lophiotrema nucula]
MPTITSATTSSLRTSLPPTTTEKGLKTSKVAMSSDTLKACLGLVTSVIGLGVASWSAIYDVRSSNADLHEACLVHSGGQIAGRSCRILWRLQDAIQQLVTRTLRLPQIPDWVSDPSSSAVFAGWLVVALVVTAYRAAYDGSHYHDVVLASSVSAAIILGMVEGTTLRGILLTNVPWCLSLGLILSTLSHIVAIARETIGKQQTRVGSDSGYSRTDKKVWAE